VEVKLEIAALESWKNVSRVSDKAKLLQGNDNGHFRSQNGYQNKVNKLGFVLAEWFQEDYHLT